MFMILNENWIISIFFSQPLVKCLESSLISKKGGSADLP